MNRREKRAIGLPDKSLYVRYYARHPAHTMVYHWKDCCRLCANVYLHYGKMLKQPAERELAGQMIGEARTVKQSVLDAFAAVTYAEALAALERMRSAKNNCLARHFDAQDRGLYANFAEEYRIMKPIADMGYYHGSLQYYFKRKFQPPKAHVRLFRRYALGRKG